MPGVPSDISMAEVQAATGPLPQWPDDPGKACVFACWVLHALQAAYGRERVDLCMYMGAFGDHRFDDCMQAALRRLARHNSLQLAAGAEAGPKSIVQQGLTQRSE